MKRSRKFDPVPVDQRKLKKYVCVGCHESNPLSHKGWTPSKESAWEEHGLVYCPAIARNVVISQRPPVGCRFSVEQVMGLKDEELASGHSGVPSEQPD